MSHAVRSARPEKKSLRPLSGSTAEGIDVALAAAAHRVEEAIWADSTGQEAGHRMLLERLCELVAAAEAGVVPPGWEALPITEAAACRWLLDEMRGGVVAEWARLVDAPPAEGMLRLLRLFEAIRLALDARADARLSRLLASFQGLDLLLGLAHDLRSPLTSILFLSEALHEGRSGGLSALQRRQVGLVYSAALGLSSMANDVIDLVRNQPQAPGGASATFSVSALLESIRDLVQPVAETRGLLLRMRPPTVDVRRGEPVALSRILLNLATNALKFTEEGTVEVVAREIGVSRVEFSVCDTGRGLGPETIARLSTEAARGGTRDRFGVPGRGLGLTICRKLLTSLGATLNFETDPGRGTRFFFELELPPA